jgi:hypothetical protein
VCIVLGIDRFVFAYRVVKELGAVKREFESYTGSLDLVKSGPAPPEGWAQDVSDRSSEQLGSSESTGFSSRIGLSRISACDPKAFCKRKS